MLKKSIIITIIIVVIVLILSIVISKYKTVEVLSKYGSRGDEVRQIQTKLKRWGYY